jgi:hypothetical protein
MTGKEQSHLPPGERLPGLGSQEGVMAEWRLDKSAIFGGLTFAITAAMGSFFEPVARLV